MRCKKCGRLSPDEVNVCKFCGAIFDESKPAEAVEPNNQLVYEIADYQKKQGKVPKYFKSGWLVIACVVAVIVLIILLITGVI
ncbi:MAG: hypothetical protein MJ147_08330 [Clostridia bacterium]|nr:hypothetical protein [Clostridia bacterium]